MRHILTIIGLCFLGFALAFSQSGVGGKGGFGGKGGSGGGTTASDNFAFVQAVNGTGGNGTFTVGAAITGVGASSICVVHFIQSITGSAAVSFSNGSAVITATNTLVANEQVLLSTTGTLPSGFSPNTIYFTSSTGLTSAHFELSATAGGSVIVAGSAGSGTQSFVGAKITDNHANTYTLTTSSPYGPVPTIADTFIAGIAYLNPCPSGNSTVTWASTGATSSLFCSVDVLEYSYTGSIAYDKDAQHSYPSSGLVSSPAILPSISPTNSGSLVVGGFVTDQGAQGTGNSPWSTVGSSGVFGSYYVLSSSGTVTASFPDSTTPDSAGSILAAFH